MIFLTAKNQVPDLVAGLAAGGNDYLAKPIGKDELLARVRTHLELLTVHRDLEMKNAELARINYTVAHDLRNPLTTIVNFLGLVRRDAAAGRTERLERDLDRLDAAAHKLRRLLDDLFELSRVGVQSNPLEEVAFGELVREKGYDLGVLLRMLDALGVDRRIFFGRVYGSSDPLALLELEARGVGEPPEIVAQVRDLLLERGWEPLAEVPAAIRRLDAHRHHDAEKVLQGAHGDLAKVATRLLKRSWGVPLLAVYGSALRMLLRLDEALTTLMAALRTPCGTAISCHGRSLALRRHRPRPLRRAGRPDDPKAGTRAGTGLCPPAGAALAVGRCCRPDAGADPGRHNHRNLLGAGRCAGRHCPGTVGSRPSGSLS